ncbi:MAG: Crp/Fnr family transcriptional regulator [Turicibacter sp.]|nr:Crp/Fnr family transcriptional regulator [Turicibacter sp.]
MSFFVEQLERSSFLKDKFEMRTFQKDEVILNVEDRIDEVFILKSGRLKTYSLSENGTKHLIKIYEAGELLGDVEVFTDSSAICYLEGMDEGEIYVIKREHFLQWMEQDFNVSLYIVRQLAQKLINTGIKMQSAVSYPLKYQVLLYIWKYVSQYKSNCIPKLLIVEELGSNIRSINRILRQLAQEGVIINQSGKIQVDDLNLILSMISHYDLEVGKR